MTSLFLRVAFAAVAALALVVGPAAAQEWDGVDRIVVIGDLEGDEAKFEAMLADAGLVNGRGNWIGGEAHLVQLGDVPDRGPNSRAIMDHLKRLERQARRAGGGVHALIGNHEAMNVKGDLRYTDPGEYAAFAGRDSERLLEAFYQQTVDYLTANPPNGVAFTPDETFRAEWEETHPPGFVEHRIAWGPEGDYGSWVAEHDAAIRINDTLFVHGGIGPAYLDYDLATLDEAVRDALTTDGVVAEDEATLLDDVLWNEDGPLWYRGFALGDEADEAEYVQAVLDRYGVSRVVTGHTKLAPTVFPRFDGRVVIADIAVPEGYDDPYAYLVIEDGALTTVHRGARVPLRTGEARCAYLADIIALDPPGSPVAARAEGCEGAGD